jgi:signal transduction histidine kinase
MPGAMRTALSLWWQRMSLAWRFTVASSATLLVATFIEGAWVSGKIEEGVKADVATAATVLAHVAIAPVIGSLNWGGSLSAAQFKIIDDLVGVVEAKSGGAVSGEIIMPSGVILYSTRKETVGKQAQLNNALHEALRGTVSVSLEDPIDGSDNIPVIRVSVPIHYNGKVISVAEIRAPGTLLIEAIAAEKWSALLVSIWVHGGVVFILFWIVAQGSRTIIRQRESLEARLLQTEELRHRIKSAAQKAVEYNQRFLRQLGADLHDGPAQLISLALLRLDAIVPTRDDSDRVQSQESDINAIRLALTDSMRDIRSLSAGLSMPGVEDITLKEALSQRVKDHERRTRTSVDFKVEHLPEHAPDFVKICLSRFVQEALNNAFKHAGGVGQRVMARAEGGKVMVEVEDGGPGFDPSAGLLSPSSGLGLRGLRDRIESLEGILEIGSRQGVGTRLSAILPLQCGG